MLSTVTQSEREGVWRQPGGQSLQTPKPSPCSDDEHTAPRIFPRGRQYALPVLPPSHPCTVRPRWTVCTLQMLESCDYSVCSFVLFCFVFILTEIIPSVQPCWLSCVSLLVSGWAITWHYVDETQIVHVHSCWWQFVLFPVLTSQY